MNIWTGNGELDVLTSSMRSWRSLSEISGLQPEPYKGKRKLVINCAVALTHFLVSVFEQTSNKQSVNFTKMTNTLGRNDSSINCAYIVSH